MNKDNDLFDGSESIRFTPSATIVFGDGDIEVGKLYFGSGRLVFYGNAAESAKIFFEHYLKPMVDGYIEEKLDRKEKQK
jgi:hypothetical protein